MEDGDAVCVTGATGYVGSWLVKRLLENGYTVHATVRDPDNLKKVKHLLELLNARTNLTLWKADLSHEGSFDDAINGCTGVFHVARTTNFESQDPENEIFKTTIEGTLNVMRSCLKAETVSRIVFTSSSGACYMQEHEKAEYTEDCWTDVEFCRTKKMTGWMYFVAKTLAEKAAWKFSEEHNLNLITIIPTLVIGPFLTPTMPHSVKTAFSPITRNEALYSMIKQGQSVHIDDLCKAHIFLYEHYEAKGRYICSSHDDTIVDRAKMLKEKFPEFDVQTQFDDIDENLSVVAFSSKKLIDLGFKYRYSLEDMYADAVESCREKGILSQVLARHVES